MIEVMKTCKAEIESKDRNRFVRHCCRQTIDRLIAEKEGDRGGDGLRNTRAEKPADLDN